jgi:hypothetical protein
VQPEAREGASSLFSSTFSGITIGGEVLTLHTSATANARVIDVGVNDARMTGLARKRAHARVFIVSIRGPTHANDRTFADQKQKGTPGYH